MERGEQLPRDEAWPVSLPLVIRERDCGAGDLLDESVLVVFFREARRAYLSVLNVPPAASVLIDVHLSLSRPIASDDELAIDVRCDELTESGYRMAYRVRDVATGESVAEGSTTSELVDEVGQPVAVPEDLRLRVAVIEGWLD